MKITGSLVVCAAAAAFTATALLVNPDPSPPAAVAGPTEEAAITISQFAFATTAVAPGATVTVHNLDGVEHTVSGASGSFESGVVAPGGTATFVAPLAPGMYALFCSIHPSMQGQLTVAAGGQV